MIIPEIADYEVRRELMRIQSHSALANLDAYGIHLEYLPLTTTAMRRAAELWAKLRQSGLPTASIHALDCDVILVSQAMDLNIPFVIASDNLAHLTRLAPADLWSNIVP
ncbi:MAG: nucleic acid-binding protein [Gemmatales bacterium]